MENTIEDLAAGAPQPMNIEELILNADPIVQGVMLCLVLASVICWAIILEKMIRLGVFGSQVSRLRRLAEDPAYRPGNGAWLAANLLAAAERQDIEPGESRIETETRLERAMRLPARAALSQLQTRMRFLATVGATAPFIGLFGTVWGIMNSFTAIAAQKDTSLAVVAPGIAEALFATALGLVAAIPAVVGYNQISGSMARITERINLAISALANGLARQRAQSMRNS